MASAAAACLQDLLHSFVSHDLQHVVLKLVPNSSADEPTSSASYTTARDAAEVLEHLSCFATHLRPLIPHSATTAVSLTKGLPSAECNNTEDCVSVLQFIGATIERHLNRFMRDISTGLSDFLWLRSEEKSTSRSPTHRAGKGAGSIGETSAADEEEEEETVVFTGTGGGPRVNFTAWVVLEVYRHLAVEAEAAMRDARLGGEVRTAEERAWELRVKEELASVSRGSSHLQDMASVLQRSLTELRGTEDVFSGDRRFFSRFMCTHLLPVVKREEAAALNMVRGSESTPQQKDVLRRSLRQWARLATAAPSLSDDSSFSATTVNVSLPHWKALATLLLGPAIAPVLEGTGDVYDASGLLQPTTPTQVAAFVAAAVGALLVPGVVGAAARWLDERLPVFPLADAGGDCAEALQHALDLCMRSVQVVPLPLCDGRDADVLSDAHVAGGWLLPPSTSAAQLQRCGEHGTSAVSCHRRVMIVPGLSIAATRIRSGASAESSHTASRTESAVVPDRATPGGTCVVSPPSALAQLLVGDAELDAATVAPCCSAAANASTTVSALGLSSLRSVEWLLLFTELPETAEELESLHAAITSTVPEGWVLAVVQASVSKATMSSIESSWGTAQRPVVVLSAVGHWGLLQLSLRFDVTPNSSATDVVALRGACGGGVAALLLHSHQYAPASPASTAAAASSVSQQRRRTLMPYTEVREQLLFVVGLVRGKEGEEVSPLSSLSVLLQSSRESASDTGSAPPQPPVMSMFHVDSSEEEEEETAESRSANDGNNSSSSSGSCYSPRSTHSSLSSSRTKAARRMTDWYGSSTRLPSLPSVTCSVLIGATTRAGQHELVYAFWHWWRQLLHRLVLPDCLAEESAVQGAGSVNVAVIRHLDVLLASDRSSAAAEKAEGGFCATFSPHHYERVRVLREALWSFELLALQQDSEGRSLDQAWRTLQGWTSSPAKSTLRSTTAAESEGASCGLMETWLQVQSAYAALGSCLDELCGAVVMGTGGEVCGAVSPLL